MLSRSRLLSIFLSCLSISAATLGLTNSVFAEPAHPAMQQSAQGKIYGKVIQTMDAGGYTYAEVDTGKEKIWAASRQTVLNKGDMIAFNTTLPMKNHHSKTLNRTFPVVYFSNQFFTDKLTENNPHAAGQSPHGDIKTQQMMAPVEGIKKVSGGYTIAEILEQRQTLKGKKIKVRGKVTKFTKNVLGKNWLHIMDSSNHNDLTAVTTQSVEINDVVVVEGVLKLDQDFNYGYVYPVLLDEASIKK